MTTTYIHYLSDEELETYKDSIHIIEPVESYNLTGIYHFTCDDKEVVNKIFGEDDIW